MFADLKGRVTYMCPKESEKGNKYRVVKLLQMNKVGDGQTVSVRVWDESLEFEVGNDCVILDCVINPTIMGNKPGHSVDKWGDDSFVKGK